MAYIYEHIRTRGVEPLNFEEHYLRLDAVMNRLFYTHLNISREELRSRIRRELQSRNYVSSAINAVCVKIDPLDSNIYIDIEEIYYEAFSVRAIRPGGYICNMGGELIMERTSARDALIDINRTMAQITDGDAAIWTDSEGTIQAIDGASVIAVFEDEIRFAASGNGVEFDLAYNAMLETPYTVTRGTLSIDELSYAKEVMGIDHRGIVVLESFNGHYYIDLTAIKIALRVAEVEG